MTTGKMTLLEIVQAVLEKMDSDEVNSIFDTVESVSVANEVRDTFRFITSNSEDYQQEGYVRLEGLSDSKYFNQLKLPDNVVRIEEFWLEDGCGGRICPEFMDPRAFVDRLFSGSSAYSTKQVAPKGDNGPCFPVGAEQDPKYYTSFDGIHLFFDSVNLTDQDTLMASETGARVIKSPEFLVADTFVPPLNVGDFSLLLNESIDACYVHFKGVSNSKAQKRAREQKVTKQNNRERISKRANTSSGPPYGRRARGL